jgi:hypothetical protein
MILRGDPEKALSSRYSFHLLFVQLLPQYQFLLWQPPVALKIISRPTFRNIPARLCSSTSCPASSGCGPTRHRLHRVGERNTIGLGPRRAPRFQDHAQLGDEDLLRQKENETIDRLKRIEKPGEGVPEVFAHFPRGVKAFRNTCLGVTPIWGFIVFFDNCFEICLKVIPPSPLMPLCASMNETKTDDVTIFVFFGSVYCLPTLKIFHKSDQTRLIKPSLNSW